MSSNYSLSYVTQPSLLPFFELQNQFLNSFLLAFLSTFLSYQSTECIFDIFLAHKKPLHAKISNLYSFLLVRQTPFRAIFTSVFNNLRFYPFSSSSMHTPQPRVPHLVFSKLLFLLTAAPMINILVVVLTLERDQTSTIAQANLGGIGLGFRADFSTIQLEPISEDCGRAPLQLARNEESFIEFNICSKHDEGFFPSLNASVGWIRMGISSGNSISMEAVIGQWASVRLTIGTLYVDEKSYYTKPELNDGGLVERFANMSVEFLKAECQVGSDVRAIKASSTPNTPEYFKVLWRYDVEGCYGGDEKSAVQVSERMASMVTFVDKPNMEILETPGVGDARIPGADPEFQDGSHLKVVKRRRRTLELLWLAVLTAGVCTMRVVIRLVCRNNLDLGMELILKAIMGIGVCGSMLWEEGRVVYGKEEDGGGARIVFEEAGE